MTSLLPNEGSSDESSSLLVNGSSKKHKRIHRTHEGVLKLFLNNLVEADLLPEQLNSGNGNKQQPEKDLWLAVLEDAIGCYLKIGETKRAKRFRRETEDWFISDDNFIGTFLWICDVIGLNADYIRKGIRQLRSKQGRVYKNEIKLNPKFLGESHLSVENIIDCVRSFRKIELWRGLSHNALRKNNLGCWRELFAYALRALSEPKLSWDNIAEVLECHRNTVINLYYHAIQSYKNGNKQFLSALKEFKQRLKNMEAIEANEGSLP